MLHWIERVVVMSDIGWEFPLNNGGVADGANDGGRDAFSGERLSSFVRETVQNSIDARKGSEPVEVYFKLEHVDHNTFPGFTGIRRHIESCLTMVKDQQHLEDKVEEYQQALDRIDSNDKVPVLCIHDANTKGLTGPLDEPEGCWYALTKGVGLSQKDNDASLGSFGHGSNAPLTMSLANQVFYLTYIKPETELKSRFQGKCRLQSYKTANGLTQGTGFYGKKKGFMPLEDQEVEEHAQWALNLRNNWKPNEVGTSIFIPFTDYNVGYYPETVITAIANYFYAILKNNLIVRIDDVTLNKDNITSRFYEYKPKLKTERDEINVRHIEKCFRSIETIINPDKSGTIEDVSEIGDIDWYMRIDNEIETRSVGVARQSGMLITNKAPGLQHFEYSKPFDMFICVKGKAGSDLLKSLENPQHTNFEFDRIRVKDSRKKKRELYDLLVKAIKKKAELAKYEDIKEIDIDIDFMVDDDKDGKGKVSRNNDRGMQLLLFSEPPKTADYGNEDGSQEGKKKPKKKKKNKKRKKPFGDVPVDGNNLVRVENGKVKEVTLVNSRVVHLEEGKNTANVYFQSSFVGNQELYIKKIGEEPGSSKRVRFGSDNKSTMPVDVTGNRQCVKVTFCEPMLSHVLECHLRIVQEVTQS